MIQLIEFISNVLLVFVFLQLRAFVCLGEDQEVGGINRQRWETSCSMSSSSVSEGIFQQLDKHSLLTAGRLAQNDTLLAAASNNNNPSDPSHCHKRKDLGSDNTPEISRFSSETLPPASVFHFSTRPVEPRIPGQFENI
jgi:hypothetical protein